jgi:DNA-binding YbaB/EbfC family protein
MQEQLEASSFTAAAGGGAVKATVSGKRELTMLQIDPGAVDPEDVEMLQDMIIAAVNEALRQVEDASSDNMAKLTGMKGLPF